MKNHLEKCNIILDEIYQDDNYNIPPWELCTPTVDLTLHSTTKNESSKSDYKQRFLERKDFYENQNFTAIYTDGSKSANHVSASVVLSTDILKVNLPDHSSIFTAEAVALRLAAQYIQRQAIPRAVVYSDSLSCIQSLLNKNVQYPTILEIIEILTYLNKVNTEIIFFLDTRSCWNSGK